LECENNSLYKGSTRDLFERINRHLDGRGSEWTKKHKPIALVHFELFDTEKEAFNREKYFKSGSGREWIHKIWEERKQKYETADVLLEKIKAGKERLIKEGKIKKQKPLPRVSYDEKPFDLPEGWVWTKLPMLLDFSNGSLRRGPFGSSIRKDMFVPKSPKSVKVYEQKNAIYKNYKLGEYYIDLDEHNNLKSFLAGPGDIIISCAGTIGETYVLPDDAPIGVINQALLKLKLNNKIIYNSFFILVFKSFTQTKINEDAKGTAMKNMSSVNYLKNELMFPLPPILEQKAIVEKVDRLMAKIDAVKVQVKERKTQAEQLMQAVLREAFNGNE